MTAGRSLQALHDFYFGHRAAIALSNGGPPAVGRSAGLRAVVCGSWRQRHGRGHSKILCVRGDWATSPYGAATTGCATYDDLSKRRIEKPRTLAEVLRLTGVRLVRCFGLAGSPG